MKKKFFVCLLLCMTLILSFASFASADSQAHVGDSAGVLTQDEYIALERAAAEVSDKYGCGVYAIIVDDYTQFGRSIDRAAEEIFNGTGMGYGDTDNGVLLLLSMNDRDYDILAHGDFGNYAFTDYGKDVLSDSFLDNFRNNDWYGGLRDYVSSCDYFLECAKDGNPIDVPQREEHKATLAEKLPIFAAISSAISALFCGVSSNGMKNAKRKTDASYYVSSGRINLIAREDFFTHRTQSVQRIPRNNNSGGGHGGTTVNAGGFSHKSGKF